MAETSTVDIGSDDSNDSFFETDNRKKGIFGGKNKKKVIVKDLVPKKMEDLFGIKEKDTSDIILTKKLPITNINQSDIKGNKVASDISSLFKVKQNKDDDLNDDDLISDLGFNPKNPKSATKLNILDDLLGTVETKRPLSGNEPATTIISRQSTETTETSIAGPRPKTSVGRRSSNVSNNDPLGIFSTDKNKKTSVDEQIKPFKRRSTADWLGLGLDSNKTEIDRSVPSTTIMTTTVPQESQPEPNSLTENTNQPQIKETINSIHYNPYQGTSAPTNIPHQNAVLIATANMETQNAMQTLKQQEAQVLMASQLKSHEFTLMEMQRRQQELLARQEAQFNELFQRQMKRQNQLEMDINSQQERINAHIQVLMSQTPHMIDFQLNRDRNQIDVESETLMQEEKSNTNNFNLIQLKADIKTLELEKLRLEDMVSTLTGTHEKELEIIEGSYRKQIQMIEENMTSIESRLRKEIESIQTYFGTKIEELENEKLVLKAKHDEDLKAIRNDHQRMIENIRESKLYEFSAIQDNTSYLNILRQASMNLDNASETMQTIKYEMETKIDLIHKENEMNLLARERKIEDAEKRLQLSEESSEQEKKHLLDLVSNLEAQLTKLSKDSQEQNWICRQKLSSIEAERMSFEKEKELARETILRDENRIAELKEHQLKETQRLLTQIHDERNALNAEKAKFEAIQKLQLENVIPSTKVEFEMALKVAQDAIKQADSEREKYFKMQIDLETQKRAQNDIEFELISRKNELETEIRSVRANERRAQESLKETQESEQYLKRQISDYNHKLEEIITRESQLAAKYLQLVQEQIKLKKLKVRLEQNKCSLCKITGNKSNNEVLLSNNAIIGQNNNQSHNSFMHRQQSSVDQLLDEDVAEFCNVFKNMRNDWNTDPTHPFDMGTGNEFVSSPTINNNVPINLDEEMMMVNYLDLQGMKNDNKL